MKLTDKRIKNRLRFSKSDCKRKQTAEHINCMICGKPLRENN